MKKIKKLILSLFAIILMLNVTVFAKNNQDVNTEAKSIVFDENTSLSGEQREIISNYLNNGEYTQTRGLACLFGHNYESSYVETISHRVNPTNPRCLAIYYIVNICTRCDKVVADKLTEKYIKCCS
jgi:hypothetical protein